MPPKKKARGRAKRKKVEKPPDSGEEQTQSPEAEVLDERKRRVAELMQEMDNEVDHQLTLLDKKLATIQKSIRAKHRQLTVKIPKFVQEMTLSEFLACGGDLDNALEKTADAKTEEKVSEKTMQLMAAESAVQAEASAQTSVPMETSTVAETPVGGKGGRPRRRAAAAASVALSARPSTRTRAAGRMADPMDTPMQTPAFRPGLSIMSKSRRGKKRMCTMQFNEDEARKVLSRELRAFFPGGKLKHLQSDEKEYLQDLRAKIDEALSSPTTH